VLNLTNLDTINDNTLQLILAAEYDDDETALKNATNEIALKYYKLSADQGNSIAQYYLGLIYLKKEENYEKGLEYIKLAPAGNIILAIEYLAELQKSI